MLFAVFEDDLVFAEAAVLADVLVPDTDLAVVASPDEAAVVFVDLAAVVLVDVPVTVTDLAVVASPDELLLSL